jgi:hypothetical protein
MAVTELSVVDEGAKAMAEVAIMAEMAAAKDFMVIRLVGMECTRREESSRKESRAIRGLLLATHSGGYFLHTRGERSLPFGWRHGRETLQLKSPCGIFDD